MQFRLKGLWWRGWNKARGTVDITDVQTANSQTPSSVIKLNTGVNLNEQGKILRGPKSRNKARMTLHEYFTRATQQTKKRFAGNQADTSNVLHQSLETGEEPRVEAENTFYNVNRLGDSEQYSEHDSEIKDILHIQVFQRFSFI